MCIRDRFTPTRPPARARPSTRSATPATWTAPAATSTAQPPVGAGPGSLLWGAIAPVSPPRLRWKQW
eukprot:10034834-Alexandrium_andersonii.AAC.1